MDYIIHHRFKGKALCGNVNLPARTKCRAQGNTLYTEDGRALCYVTSENAHTYFARNDDGEGMARGKLIERIKKTLGKRDDGYQARWDKVWEDKRCLKYKRADHADFFLWNHEFYNAPMVDLIYIARLVGTAT